MKGKAISSIGKIRKANEDSFGIHQGNQPFYMVADGMGGHKGGAVASKEAVTRISRHLQNHLSPEITGEELEKLLEESVFEANRDIFQIGENSSECRGMGTTLTLAVPLPKDHKVYFAHIGDSRAYAIEKEEIYQVTKDHSLVQELVVNGDITEEEAKEHPKRNVITRALGTESEVWPDVFSIDFSFEAEHYLLLCTDGLSNAMEEEEIKRVVQNSESIEEACEDLINKANERGGHDNITVLILQGS